MYLLRDLLLLVVVENCLFILLISYSYWYDPTWTTVIDCIVLLLMIVSTTQCVMSLVRAGRFTKVHNNTAVVSL